MSWWSRLLGGTSKNEASSRRVDYLSEAIALERQGDFSQSLNINNGLRTIYDPWTSQLQGTAATRQPFAGNIIPASRINPDGQKILSFYPTPNTSDAQFNYQTQVSDKFPRRENIYRGDYNINDKYIVVSVEVRGGKAKYMVNGKEVHKADAGSVDASGIVGYRVNHNLDIHLGPLGIHPLRASQ